MKNFLKFINSMPVPLVLLEKDGTVLTLSEKSRVVLGNLAGEIVPGSNIKDFLKKYASQELRSEFFTERDNNFSIEIDVNGDKRFFDFRTMSFKIDEEPFECIMVYLEDVTERVLAERSLRESEARNRALIEAIPDIMFRVDNRGVYLDKMLGVRINEIFPAEISVEVVRYISEAIRTREIQVYEYSVVISGEERFYEARFIAVEDDEVLVILRNTTEKQKVLMELEKARRTAEIANRTKSEFLANMSHEIRTPLNSITGFIELLMRTELNDQQKEFIEIIKRSASNLLEIINDILDFSKIESKRLVINPLTFDLYGEVESLCRLFNVKALDKGITFLTFIDPAIPLLIKQDSLRIKQILSNLISNAIKFTPEGGTVIVEAKIFRKKESRCMINFSVSDTGIGIPERKQKMIFEPFTQADGSVTRKYGGTGLGLAISANLAKLLGSEILLESKTGIGSKFYFTLEAEIIQDECKADRVKGLSLKAVIVSSVPDDMNFINIQYYLSSFNVDISFFSSIESALKNDFDLCFILYSKTIYSELQSLRRLPLDKSKFILVITGSGYEVDENILNLFSYRIIQPVFPDDILKLLQDISGLNMAERSLIHDENNQRYRKKFHGRVLVGEDNKINQKLIMLLLRDYGLEVDIAGNGIDVFEKFQRNKYDLVFMDIQMPVVDGIETAKMIREYESDKDKSVPIVALTAKTMSWEQDILAESGMDAYIIKPIEMNRLEEILERYLTVSEEQMESEISSDSSTNELYSLRAVAEELKIPVNVLENILIDFFDDAIEVIDSLKTAERENNFVDIMKLSHRLKGAAYNLRLNSLGDILEIIEEKSNKKEEADYKAMINSAEKEIMLYKNYIQ